MILFDSKTFMHWIFVYFSADLSICLSTNVIVLRIATGAPFGIYDFYLNETLFGGFPNSSSQQYKSEIINDWEKTNIHEVTIRIYKEKNLTAFFVFDGRNTSKFNWMSTERFKGSSYTDLTKNTVGSLQFLQISYQDTRTKRKFYISKLHDGCEGDIGWLLVKESVISKPCTVDNVSATTIWYSYLTASDKFSDFHKADSMTVEVSIDVICDDSYLQIDNAVHNVTGNQFNDSVTYRCLEGFNHTSGDLYRRCNHLGDWTGTSPSCNATCDVSRLQIVNAVYNVTGNQFNDSVTYRCLEGFNHTSGDLYRRCNHLGDWTGTSPSCNATCDVSRLQIVNAVYNVTGNQFNDSVTYRCLEGFNHTSGDLYRRCNRLGDWTGTSPSCNATCDVSRLQIVNAVYSVTGNQFNDSVTYRCLEGFNHTSGDLYRQCNHLGDWTGASPTCSNACYCPCGSNEYIKVNDTEALQARLNEIKSKLSIKANETSKAQRLKVCAKDDRTSAKAVGGILGGLLIGSFVLSIIASDLPVLIREIKKAYRNIRS